MARDLRKSKSVEPQRRKARLRASRDHHSDIHEFLSHRVSMNISATFELHKYLRHPRHQLGTFARQPLGTREAQVSPADGAQSHDEIKESMLTTSSDGRRHSAHSRFPSNPLHSMHKEALTKLVAGLIQRRHSYRNLQQHQNSLSFRVRQSFCAPTFATLPVITLLSVYLAPFYELLGSSLGILSFVIALARSLDVMSDPLMSYITDSMRSRFGRRKPFCIIGCWFYAAFLAALLNPPTLSKPVMALWFGCFYNLFFLSNTFTTIPYDALGLELTDNYDDRSQLFFVSGLYDGFGALIAITMPIFVANLAYLTSTCDVSSCFHEDGTGVDCLPQINSGLSSEYDLGFNATFASFMSTMFIPSSCETDQQLQDGHLNYCSCVETCNTRCSLASQRTAFGCVGLFFGAWFCVSMTNMVFQVKERWQKINNVTPEFLNPSHSPLSLENNLSQEGFTRSMATKPAMIPTLLNTLRNPAFSALLPAWICDSIGYTLLASMMTFYVRYVVQPEYQTPENGGIDCNNGVPVYGEESSSWQCNSTYVVGASITVVLLSAFVGTPIWLLAAKRLGKRQAWLLWSFTMAMTNIVWLCVGKGDVVLGIVVSGLNGFPLGAKFLADAILGDIIDYDELLTGQRNEASYIMFKSFLPKICAIPSAAVPLTILNSIGHVAPEDGRIMEQPEHIATYCIFVFSVIPFVLSVLSFVFKLRFPLKNKQMCDAIAVGIGQHLLGEHAIDPLSKEPIFLLSKKLTQEQLNDVQFLDHFPGEQWVTQILEEGAPLLQEQEYCQPLPVKNRHDLALIKAFAKKKKAMQLQLLICIGSLGISLFSVCYTFDMLQNQTFSMIPVLLVVYTGISLSATAFCAFRLRACRVAHKKIKSGQHQLSFDVVKAVRDNRRLLKKIEKASKKRWFTL